MRSFEFYTPTKVVFGKDAEEKTGKLVKDLGHRKVLIVHGKSAAANGLLAKVEKSLADEGIEFVSQDGVSSNPHLSQVEALLETARRENVEFIVAVGGGSVIDAAKAVSIGLANPDVPIWDFFTQKQPLTKTCGLGAVVTMAAAGSEMSDSCVITKDEGLVKIGLGSDLNRPQFAIMNPENTYTVPIYQVRSGIADILMHTLERYFGVNTTGNMLTDEISEGLLRVVIENGKVAKDHPDDYDAASELLWAGSLSHNNLTGLGTRGDFAVHQLGHELSALYGVAHGASLTAVWGAWAKYVYKNDVERFAKYARNVWGIQEEDTEKAALAGIAATVDYFRFLELPVSLMDLKVSDMTEEDLRLLTLKCTRQRTRNIGRFVELKEEDIYNIYKAARE